MNSQQKFITKKLEIRVWRFYIDIFCKCQNCPNCYDLLFEDNRHSFGITFSTIIFVKQGAVAKQNFV